MKRLITFWLGRIVTHYNDPHILAEVSKGLGEPMVGIAVSSMASEDKLAKRGW